MEREEPGKKGRGWRTWLFWIAVLAAALVAAFFFGAIAVTELCPSYLGDGNGHYIWLPESVSDFFYGEVVNLDFSMPQGAVLHTHGSITDGKIGNLKCGSSGGAGYKISMGWVEALQLATTDKPITTFKKYWKEGKIRIYPRNELKESMLADAEALLTEDDEPVPEGIREYYGQYKGNAT